MYSFFKNTFLLFLFIAAASLPSFAQNVPADTLKTTPSQDASVYISSDSLLKKVELLHTTLNKIGMTSRGVDTKPIESQLPEIQNNLALINDALTNNTNMLNSRNIQLFQVLLTDMQAQLDAWRTQLFDYNKELISMHVTMQGFKNDTAFLKQVKADTLFRELYKTELTGLKEKWIKASARMNDNLAKVNTLQASVSNSYFQSMEMQNSIRRQLMRNSRGAFSQEYSPLWQFKNDSTQVITKDAREKSVNIQKRILNYYFKKVSDNWLWIGLIGLVFLLWVMRNFFIIKKNNEQAALQKANITHIKPVPVLSTLVLMLTIVPFFDLNPPVIYIQLIQFSLLIVLTIKLWNTWNRKTFLVWVVILILYFLFGFSHVINNAGIPFRLLLLAANIGSVVFGFYLFRVFKNMLFLQKFSRIAIGIFIALNALAVLCNFTGRLSVSKVMSSAAIFSITQLIGLSVFIQLVAEFLHLQMIATRVKGGKTASFNYEKIQKSFTKLLSTVAIICWFIILFANLNIYPILYSLLSRLLNTAHTIGSITFTASHVLLFFVIIYVSNILQKYVGYFLGETEDDFATQASKKNSKLAIIRLLLLLAGFLLAIAASGLAVDKITVVLGALGVGIGLGLQTIVNNLVSGVILIFERPFQIGDFIEISDKKGKVKDMGIRSSRMITEDGAEIIIPNGDLLSGRVTNWTLSNDHIRAVLTFKLQPVDLLEVAKTAIMDSLNASEMVMQRLPKEILVSSINDSAAEVKVLFWVNNIHTEQLTRSLVLTAIYQALKQKEISIL